MGNLIVISIVALVLFLAIKPIIKHHKERGNGEVGCYKCSQASNCSKKCNK